MNPANPQTQSDRPLASATGAALAWLLIAIVSLFVRAIHDALVSDKSLAVAVLISWVLLAILAIRSGRRARRVGDGRLAWLTIVVGWIELTVSLASIAGIALVSFVLSRSGFAIVPGPLGG